MGSALSEWCVVLSIGAVGGILCAWNPADIRKVDEIIGNFLISLIFIDLVQRKE